MQWQFRSAQDVAKGPQIVVRRFLAGFTTKPPPPDEESAAAGVKTLTLEAVDGFQPREVCVLLGCGHHWLTSAMGSILGQGQQQGRVGLPNGVNLTANAFPFPFPVLAI